jgi:integrase
MSRPARNDHAHAADTLEGAVAERMGQSKASMSLDVYTHGMDPEEVKIDTVSALIRP